MDTGHVDPYSIGAGDLRTLHLRVSEMFRLFERIRNWWRLRKIADLTHKRIMRSGEVPHFSSDYREKSAERVGEGMKRIRMSPEHSRRIRLER